MRKREKMEKGSVSADDEVDDAFPRCHAQRGYSMKMMLIHSKGMMEGEPRLLSLHAHIPTEAQPYTEEP